MAEHQRQVCITDLTRAQSCIRYVVEFDDRFPQRARVPPFFPLDRLAKVYPIKKMVQISAAKAKRSVLHALGFLSWWTTVIVSWEENLSDGAVSIITSLLSTVKGKRGVICDLERDWSTINLPLYIQNSIPFFYLWNFEARADNRFSRLNPALNLTYLGSQARHRLIACPRHRGGGSQQNRASGIQPRPLLPTSFRVSIGGRPQDSRHLRLLHYRFRRMEAQTH